MGATTAQLNNILNYTFGAVAFSPANPATMYFGLSTTTVDATGLASSTEPLTASGYARIAFTNNQSSHWHNSTAASIHNDIAVTFAESTAAWGTILSVFIADSGTRAAGNIIWYQTLSPSLVVQDNTIVEFPAESIVVTMT